ncbi:MAG: hypothetical protein JXB15_15415 [Anaerolineales bacterium]|nr:hypothetical protein [Anaerolineales bacterium]
MQRLFLVSTAFFLLWIAIWEGCFQPAPSTPSASAAITSPVGGQALQGVVSIQGNTAVDGFLAAEITFSYFNNPAQTWFIIQQSDTPVMNGPLAQWDTTTISDGIYTLRLVVLHTDGSQETVNISGVRVRNYTAIETDTPTPPPPTATPAAQATAEPASSPTATGAQVPTEALAPTPLPPNPLQVSRLDVAASVGLGALAGLGILVLLGLYQALRLLFRHR